MIDLENERGLPPAEAAAILPSTRPGKRTHSSRVVRMILKGVVLPDGSRLRLEAIKVGQQWITTARCIREFGERVAAAEISAEDDVPRPRASTTRRREVSRSNAELDRIGI